MKKFLELKHWHLFLLIFICASWKSHSPLEEIINSIAIVTISLWIYSIGVYGHQPVLNLGLSAMKIKLFRFNVILVGATLLSLFIWFHLSISDTLQMKDIPLAILSIYLLYALFQPIFFVAKVLAKIQHRNEVIFSDYLYYLLLICFFPFGIWIVQPKINRIFMTPIDSQ